MPGFPRKTFTVAASGHTYDYIHIEASHPEKSTIVFFHGFPAIAFGWRHHIQYFAHQGYGIIAPDALGYGGSSKPEEVGQYRHPGAVEDIIALLDHEQVSTFHGVGHDAGSHTLSRIYNYHPARLLSLTFIAVPYSSPTAEFDLKVVNQLTLKLLGFEKFGYISFLASEHSHTLIDQHVSLFPFFSVLLQKWFPVPAAQGWSGAQNTPQLESFQSIAYHKNVEIKADNFYPPGKLEAWLKADRNDREILQDAEESAAWLEAFRIGGFRGPTNGYRLLTGKQIVEDDKAALAAGQLTTTIGVPVLAIEAQPDKSSIPGFVEKGTRPHAPQLTAIVVGSQGHYPHILSKDEVNQAISDLIKGVESWRTIARFGHLISAQCKIATRMTISLLNVT
jgi:soluble epoxide hydrolase / lipid-phosphate phosphatase